MSDQNKALKSVVASMPQIYFDIIARVVPGIVIISSLVLATTGPETFWNVLQTWLGKSSQLNISTTTIFIGLTFVFSYVLATFLWCAWSWLWSPVRNFWDDEKFRWRYENVKKGSPAAGDRITKLKAQVHMSEVLTVGFILSVIVDVGGYFYDSSFLPRLGFGTFLAVLAFCSCIARRYFIKHMISSLNNNLELLGHENGIIVLLFDFDGTLVDLNKLKAYQAVVTKYASHIEPNLAEILFQADNELCMEGEYDRRKVFEKFPDNFQSKSPKQLCQIFWKKVCETQKRKSRCFETLAELNKAGYTLVCVTDSDGFGGNKSRRIKAAKLSKFFEKIFIGMENVPFRKGVTGYMKWVVRELGIKPSRCVIIGDKIPIDLEPAKSIGISTILVKNESYPDEWCPQVESLSELISIIKELKFDN
jgi:FMN phosphatase YigB (HAD superfamily)